MKKVLSIILTLSLLLACALPAFAELETRSPFTVHDTENGIFYSIDNEKVYTGSLRPIITETEEYGVRYMLPFRDVASSLGYSVSWDNDTYIAYASKGSLRIEIPTSGSGKLSFLYENDALLVATVMNVSPILTQEALYVDMRILENLFPDFYFLYTTSEDELGYGAAYSFASTDELPSDIRSKLYTETSRRSDVYIYETADGVTYEVDTEEDGETASLETSGTLRPWLEVSSKDSLCFLPISDLAAALGYEAIWDDATRNLTLTKGTLTTRISTYETLARFSDGSDEYITEASITLDNGTLYADIESCESLFLNYRFTYIKR